MESILHIDFVNNFQNQKEVTMKITKSKKLVYFTSLFLMLCLLVAPQTYGNDLSDHSKEELLTVIGNMCLDTWCEGGVWFDFHTFNCDFDYEECVFGFTYWEKGNEDDYYEHECTLDVPSEDYIFEDSSHSSMSQNFYWEVSDCIDYS